MPRFPHRAIAALMAGATLTLASCAVADDHHGIDGHRDGHHRDDRHADHHHGDGDRGRSPAEGAREIEVIASSFTFTPDEITVTVGEEIAIALTSTDIEHDFVIDDAAVHVDADGGDTGAGALRIDEPGTYIAYCSIPGHREAGMVATVIVTS